MRTWENGANGALHYYALDLPSNNVVGLFNTTGSATHAYHYSPYGEAHSSSEPTHNPLRFAARELDAQTGLYYVRARWYDPFLGRFISEDPIGFAGGINQYAYALNDPVNLSDPTGLWTCDRNDVTNECSNGATLSGITVTVQRGPNSGFSAFLFRSRGTSFGAGIVIGGWNDDGSGPQRGPEPEETMLEEAARCGAKVLGLEDIVDVGLIAAGQPISGTKRFRTPGSSAGTSLAGMAADRVFGNRKFSRRMRSIVGGRPEGA